jgi:tRNA(Ile)-lysidine synthase
MILSKVNSFVEKNHLLVIDDKLLLAISGGVDSMVMLHVFQQLNYSIHVAHCNFKLRGKDADGDEKFVINYCESNGIPFSTTCFDTEKFAEENRLSIQMAARELRYNWFNQLCNGSGFTKIVTAHTADDQTETMLLNFTRGLGPSSMRGIPVVNNNIVRPMLSCDKNDIITYAKTNNINWQEDSSNRSDYYQRNLIRHHIIPKLHEINPSLNATAFRFGEAMQEQNVLAREYSKLLTQQWITSSNQQLTIQLLELKQHAAKYSLLYFILESFGFNFTQVQEILNSPINTSGKKQISKTHEALLNRHELIVQELNSAFSDDTTIYFQVEEKFIVTDTFQLHFDFIKNDTSLTLNESNKIAYINADKLQFPLKIRKWKHGDYFYPLGSNGSKKLSDFFINLKLSLHQKNDIWLLICEDEIVWILGYRIDERFKVTDECQELIKFEIK